MKILWNIYINHADMLDTQVYHYSYSLSNDDLILKIYIVKFVNFEPIYDIYCVRSNKLHNNRFVACVVLLCHVST